MLSAFEVLRLTKTAPTKRSQREVRAWDRTLTAKGTTLNRNPSGLRAAYTSSTTHLALVPAPSAPRKPRPARSEGRAARLLHPIRSAAARAYRAGRLDALAAEVDVRVRALAGIDRIDEMDLAELEELAEFVADTADAKRAEHPALHLVPAATPAPGFVIQHTASGRFQVVASGSDKPVDGRVFSDFDAAMALRDRLNTRPVTA